ncbi:MAG: hypothetical protein K2Y09_08925 [Nitrosomonas sp.]|uniref:hypothetical protein n=1 Tax=Nitrosomonas sp. TaxID=42353 RepID=UPI001D2DC077|nr:hypothetical protein [Nitrosomonas sp.]MBX9895287.1 hypothetical protein [Nitrosomonas sp.]
MSRGISSIEWFLCCFGRDFNINDSKSREQRLYGQSLPVPAIPYPDEWNRILLLYGIILGKLKEDKIMKLSAVLTLALEGGYVAFNPETGATTQG